MILELVCFIYYYFSFLFFLTTFFPSISNYLHLFLFYHTLSSLTFYLSPFILLHTSFSLLIIFTFPSLIPSSHSTPLLMVDSFEECTWFDGKFTNFVRIWAYEQPLCSNYFYYVNINLSLFILELALLCMLKPHYGIFCIKMIRANHLPFFYSRIFFFFFLYPKTLIYYLCLSLNHYPSNSLRLLNHFSSFWASI